MAKTANIFTEQSDEAKAARRQMARVDCDIEGMAFNPEIDRLCEQWIAEGIPHDEYLRRLKAAVQNSEPAIAAE